MKTEKEIKEQLKKLKDDVRVKKYKKAIVEINAPLALIQTELESKIQALEWVLKS